MNYLKNMVLQSFHQKNLHKKSCPISFPWGWRSQECIDKMISERFSTKVIPDDSIIDNSYIYKTNFTLGAKQGYYTIYQAYMENENFLNYSYTSPSLSLAINYLITLRKEKSKLNLDNIKVDIIDNWIEKDTINSRDKILGFYDKDELIHHLIAGGVGPEFLDLWDQTGYKQIVRVKYILDDRIDIWDWERDIIDENMPWQVRNINNIIEL